MFLPAIFKKKKFITLMIIMMERIVKKCKRRDQEEKFMETEGRRKRSRVGKSSK
jgi:hypothetical protein